MRKPIIIALIVVFLFGGVAFLLFFQPSADSITESNKTSDTSDSAAANTTNNSKTSSADVNNDIIQTKTDPTLGKYLTNKDDLTLYTYSADEDDTSNCKGACLAVWPAYVTDSETDNLPNNISTIKRSDDNTTQYTYKGQPLYYFVNDGNGMITGDNVDGFHVAKP